jgi:threonine aldolase
MRQRIGGGWRQAGILAAAGIVALEEMVDRLTEDHEKAEELAKGLIRLGFGVDPDQVQTNIVYVDLAPLGIDSEGFSQGLAALGIKVKPVAPGAVRMVTHKDIMPGDINRALKTIKTYMEKL